MASGFKKGPGWKKLQAALDPKKFTAKLKKNVGKATSINGELVKAAIQRGIQRGRKPKGAALTILIKKSRKPLVDKGELFGAITAQQSDWKTVFVGVLRNAPEFSIAETLHEGANIPVTPAMRALFTMLWWVSQGKMAPEKLTGRAKELWEKAPGIWLPLKASTGIIHIPSRPFIRLAFANNKLKKAVKQNWNNAVAASLGS